MRKKDDLIEIVELQDKLKAWKKERGLTIVEQRAGLTRNLFEEIGELGEAIRIYQNPSSIKIKSFNDYLKYTKAFDKSDFTISFEDDPNKKIYRKFNLDKLKLYYGEYAYIDALCDIFVFSVNAFDEQTTKPVDFEIRQVSEEDILPLLYNICKLDVTAIYKLYELLKGLAKNLGYDFYSAMNETIKEIDSRTGAYDPKIGKWVKFTTPEAKALWYYADYSKCKN